MLCAQLVFAAFLKRRLPCWNDSWPQRRVARGGFPQLSWTLEIEAVAENHFGNQMIRGVRHADAQAEIHFPPGGKIQVDGRKELLLLLTYRKKIRRRTN